MFDLTPRKNPQIGVKLQSYIEGAEKLGCQVSAIRAVFAVETSGSGFLKSGKPKILFEGHIFHRLTNGKFSTRAGILKNVLKKPATTKNTDLSSDEIKLIKNILTVSYPKWTKKFYLGGEREYTRLSLAMMLDEGAALKSASYSTAQIVGENYKLAGYEDVYQFVEAMFNSESLSFDSFVSYVKNTGLADELRRKDFTGFAKGYNGSSYYRNNYDVKMKNAEKAFADAGANKLSKHPTHLAKDVNEVLPCINANKCTDGSSANQLGNTSLDDRYQEVNTNSTSPGSDTPALIQTDTSKINPADSVSIKPSVTTNANSLNSALTSAATKDQIVPAAEDDSPSSSAPGYFSKKLDALIALFDKFKNLLGADFSPVETIKDIISKLKEIPVRRIGVTIFRTVWKQAVVIFTTALALAKDIPSWAWVLLGILMFLYLFRHPLINLFNSFFPQTTKPSQSV